MSERYLKIIFAFVVLFFVAVGKNFNSAGTQSMNVVASDISDYRTASLVANNTPSKDENAIFSINRQASSSIPSIMMALIRAKNIPKISAPMFLLGDIDTTENVVQLSVNKRWPIASLTKLMTAVVALEEIPLGTNIPISEKASVTPGSARIFIPGTFYKIEDLIKAMVITSSNQAAFAIEEFIGQDKFAELMNSVSKRIGMNDTYYEEATGLSVLNQSTIEDLKILTNYIWDNHNNIFKYSRLQSVFISEVKSRSKIEINNINIFAGRPDYLGGKTGYISESGENLISIFSRSNRPIITIVLGADDRFLETEKLIKWFDETIH